ncbi:HAD family hydrolase [Streptomyces sp. NPDC005480]|uniref:HAD family hydrolase n=1 Tax=Streptomyces sp. NPDC005480 TaxID=3154880 RepID=UPI0033A18B0A
MSWRGCGHATAASGRSTRWPFSTLAPNRPPDGLNAALSRLGVRPENAMFVGDSPTDMTAARAAGVLALGAAWGWHPPAALRAVEGRVAQSGTNQFASSSVMVMNGSGDAPGVRTPHASCGTR